MKKCVLLLLIVLIFAGFNLANQQSTVLRGRGSGSVSDSWGTATAFFDATPYDAVMQANSDGTQVVATCINNGDGSAGDLQIANVDSSANLSITWGSSVEFDSDIYMGSSGDDMPSACFFDSDAYVAVIYGDDGEANDAYIEIWTISGRELSNKSTVEYMIDDYEHARMIEVAPSKLLIIDGDDATEINAGVRTMDGSGVVASSSHEQQISTIRGNLHQIAKIANDKAVDGFRDADTDNTFRLVSVSISGNTVTASSVLTPISSLGENLTQSWFNATCSPKDNYFVSMAATFDNGSSTGADGNRLFVVAGRVDNDTDLTCGVAFVVSDEYCSSPAIARVDNNNVILTWITDHADYTPDVTLAYVVLTVDWNTFTFSNSNFSFPIMPSATANVVDATKTFVKNNMGTIAAIDDNKVVVGGQESGAASVSYVGAVYANN